MLDKREQVEGGERDAVAEAPAVALGLCVVCVCVSECALRVCECV